MCCTPRPSWRRSCVRAPTVITIYDVSFALFPQFFRGFNQTYLRVGTRWSARHAQRIIAISDCTRRDVHRLYGVPLDRIDVAYPGVDETLRRADPDRVQAFRRLKNLPDKFLLYLGTLEPRKNLVDAGARLCAVEARVSATRCWCWRAASAGWPMKSLAAIEACGVKDSVVLPGYVAAEEKALWYAAATAFVFPSLYEGFGLPPLEAMACGTPVVTSNAASLPEVVGDAGLMLAPDDVSGWAAALQARVDGCRLSGRVGRSGCETGAAVYVAGHLPPDRSAYRDFAQSSLIIAHCSLFIAYAMSRYPRWLIPAVILSDVVLINAAFLLAYAARYRLQLFRPVEPEFDNPIDVYFPFMIVLTILLIAAYKIRQRLCAAPAGHVARSDVAHRAQHHDGHADHDRHHRSSISRSSIRA